MQTVRLIDRGGFGYVEEVEDSNGNRYARKTFDPVHAGLDHDQLKRRFAREVRIQSVIVHPNIMPIVESDLTADPPWFTMPLATESYEERIRRDRANGDFDTAPWPDILAAVEELHRLGYVHRDLKPANILLVNGAWMISDLGLILPTVRETTVLTNTNSAYGSQFYAAPEQALDFKNSPLQADIFALGCILHDATEDAPVRIPFAQIRQAGPYGPLLERATEVDHTKRVPSISALRAALFEILRTTSYSLPSEDDQELLEALEAAIDSSEAWRAFLNHIEEVDSDELDTMLRAIKVEAIEAVSSVDEILFSRLVDLLCKWASGRRFEWDYCDVIGDRLLAAYRISNTRLKCALVLATLELGVWHNRWHVMGHAGSMLGVSADDGLIDRFLIEMQLDESLRGKLLTIEERIRWSRGNWHEKIVGFLNQPPEASQ